MTTDVGGPVQQAGPSPLLAPGPPVNAQATVNTHFTEGSANRRGWIVKGLVLTALWLIIVGAAQLLQSAVYFEFRWTAIVGVAVSILVMAVMPPRGEQKRTLSRILAVSFVAICAALFVWMIVRNPWGSGFTGPGAWLLAFAATLVAAAAWLSLRGRTGLEFLSLIPAGLAALVAVPGLWEMTHLAGVFRHLVQGYVPRGAADTLSRLGSRLVWLGGEVQLPGGPAYLGQALGFLLFVALPIAIAAWVAAIPGLRRAEGQRLAQVALRKTGAETAAALHAPQWTSPQGQPVYVATAPRSASTNGLAIASLVLGVIGGSVLAIVLGHIARKQIRTTGQNGGGMALAGLILGYITLAVEIVLLITLLGALA
jgi:hypothetical protein